MHKSKKLAVHLTEIAFYNALAVSRYAGNHDTFLQFQKRPLGVVDYKTMWSFVGVLHHFDSSNSLFCEAYKSFKLKCGLKNTGWSFAFWSHCVAR